MKKILQYGSPVLEQKSKNVSDPKDTKISKLIDDMLEVLDSVKEHSAGLSAPQIGVVLRVAICRRVDLEEERDQNDKGEGEPIWEVMINPEIKKQSDTTSLKWEGCLSVNEGDLFGEVERSEKITVEYTNIEGDKVELTADDYFAHVVQHEIDHLNGILFIKYIKDPTELYTSEELEDLEKKQI